MSEKAKKLSTEPYKGVRDFFPEDMAVQNYIFGVWRKTAESFGYEEYGASVLEPAELYRAKSGEEIVNEQTYTFTDRGDREVTLRPEMTPTVARMVSAKRRELGLPLRWYSIPNLFRYEQPQRGRVREHWQLNVDLFGADSPEADAEIVILASRIMETFGAKDSDFTIKISSRAWLDKLFDDISADLEGFDATFDNKNALLKLLDVKAKDPDRFDREIVKLHPKLSGDFIARKSKALQTSEEKSYADLEKLVATLGNMGIKNVELALTEIVRGFDYYTGMIFEIFDTDPSNRRSLFGGGRYDDLTSLFGGERIPAVGFGMGDLPVKNFLETHGLLPAPKSRTDIHVCTTSSELVAKAEELATKLRAKGMNVSVNLTSKKIGDQIAWADKRGIPKVVVVGEEEAKTGKYKAKELATGAEAPL
ncbi:MAG: histidine--tRNA ligase [Patescibacteria group bacterium]|nr:histidine--tRNA ligase [Patescibacteria group bacterium]